MDSTAQRRFDHLYEEYFRDVLAYCLRRGPVVDGYDAANEVFAIAWRRIDDVPGGEAARPWLFVVAKRVVYRRRRSVLRFRKLAEKAASVVTVAPPNPETVVVQRAEYDAVLAAASRLSQSDRELLRLAAWEGLSHREIADVVGCSVAAVDQRLHRAKQRLARHYHAMHRVEAMRRAAGGGAS
jgi:RNA polymerase sigma-70 factor (ECF subfamily)